MVEQRARVLAAVALADWGGEPTIARVTQIAGVGRSTLYEYFDDFEHAARQVVEEASALVDERLAGVSLTEGRESLRALCEAWMLCIEEAPILFLSALSRGREELTPPARALQRHLLEWLHELEGTDVVPATHSAGARPECQRPSPELRAPHASDEGPAPIANGMILMLAASAQCLALALAEQRFHASEASDASAVSALSRERLPRGAPALAQMLGDAACLLLAPD